MPQRYRPMPPVRVLDVTEIGRYECCALMWWYDRHYPMAAASEGELRRRIALLEAVYGAGASALAEYHVFSQLQARAATVSPPPEVVPSLLEAIHVEPPHRLFRVAVVIAALVIGLVLAGIVFGAMQR